MQVDQHNCENEVYDEENRALLNKLPLSSHQHQNEHHHHHHHRGCRRDCYGHPRHGGCDEAEVGEGDSL